MKPDFSSIPDFYRGYVAHVEEYAVIEALKVTQFKSVERFGSIPEQNGDFRYATGKWSIKELINHIIDAERVFCYRALSFARNDRTELPGFKENDWASASQADRRSLSELIGEYKSLRQTTIYMFEGFSDDMLNHTGMANGAEFSVVNLGYIMAGHNAHHNEILSERYLSS